MRARKVKLGDDVKVHLLDHKDWEFRCHGTDEPAEFVAQGKVVEITDDKIIIHSWYYADPEISPDSNLNGFTIPRCAIVNITIMEDSCTGS